jgi:hypothetical protein
MYNILFKIESLLASTIEASKDAPLFISESDVGTLAEVLGRVTNKADKAVKAGAVRPSVSEVL